MQPIFNKILLGADFSIVNPSLWVGLFASLVFLFRVVFNWQHTKHRQLPLPLKSVFFIEENATQSLVIATAKWFCKMIGFHQCR
jgi:hypothetical protein